MIANQSRGRAGVILLIVLLLLTLMAVLLLTLIAVTAQGRLSALAAARAEPEEPPKRLLNQAFAQVIRGSTASQSVLGAHSLLEDLYGNTTLYGRIESAPIALVTGAIADLPVVVTTPPNELPLQSGDYDGRLLTFVTGPAKAHSARIVGSTFESSSGITTLRIITPCGLMPGAGDQVLVNGRPFSGTGFGFQVASFNPGNPAATRLLDALDPTYAQLRALLPNHAAFLASPDYTDPGGPGGANEDYDAVDFQNMLLAFQLPSSSGTSIQTVLPSLHRPDLVNFWMTLSPGLWSSADFRRRVILRPLNEDHPNFTGGNAAAFDGVNGPWDVDNDNDGSPDSIWVDLGMAVRGDRRGRRYKPLFAILCVDLDGRLNLNAHGNLNHLDAQRSNSAYGPFALTSGSMSQTPVSLVCGSGYGTAEVNLGSLFLPAEMQSLMTGSASQSINGRYGEITRTDLNGALPHAGRTFEDDRLNQLQQFELPQVYANFTTPGDFGTPPDLDGDGQMGLDLRGQPYYVAYGPTAGWGEAGERIDDPYELNLSADVMAARMLAAGGLTAIDGRFTPGELSAVLRAGDVDFTSLPQRLLTLAPQGFASVANRHRVTTDSWDVPAPSLVVTAPDLLGNLYALATSSGAIPRINDAGLTQLLRARMIAAGFPNDPGALAEAANLLLAPESRAGLRLDLNRPLGDGADDNGNAVVDEPAEAMQEASWSGVYGSAVAFDLNNDGQINAGDTMARQDLARHLYVLMMLLKDQNFLIDRDANPANNVPETARCIAQWAVNVVDFRDRDSIMTPFEYDINPFDGWTVDGNPATQEPEGDVVWGCERTQLLITETLAFHDRATEDLATPGGLTTDQPNPDPDFDQRWMPQGSLFVELYNPWSAADAPPAELTNQNAPLSGAIDLSRTDAQTHQSPVWRLLIVAGTNPQDLQYDPDGWNQQPAGASIERSVYFADPIAAHIHGDGQEYFTTTAVAPLLPNCYAVIGPSALTYVGRREDANLQNNRRISLGASSFGSGNPVEVDDNNASGNNTPQSPNDIKPPVAIIIDQPRRLSVSEPVGGYSYAPATYTDTGGFQPVFNTPLDAARTYSGNDKQAILTTGTTAPFRRLHLQRLANPLAPYHPQLNPYRTIDAMPVDLTSFTGRSENQKDTQYAQAAVAFASRQRGDADAQSQAAASAGGGSASSNSTPNNSTPPKNQLWKQEPLTKTLISEPAWSSTGAYYFPYPILQTLGYLNTSYYLNYSSYYSDTGYTLGAGDGQFWKSLNPAPTGQAASPQDYAGDPAMAFPWLTWNNRPYVSPLELLLVPAYQSSQLLARFSLLDPAAQPYSPAAPQYYDNYGQQLSLFGASPLPGAAANFYRVLDFVRIPSRFVATDVYENPSLFAGSSPGSDSLHPPFNRVSTYREPGRLNLNTVFEQSLWQSMLDGFPAAGYYWQQLVAGRRGYSFPGANNVGNAYTMNAAYPTIFAQPFRSAAGATLAPLASMRPPAEISGTLLRPGAILNASDPMFSYTAADAFRDTSRNPYFRYQALNKLGNLATTRSNVYAVWITMGFFEAEPVPIDDAHPDGYRLGAELGLDTGETQRHRAFYMYDRSIPVGFRRGEDLNTAKGILIEQFIE